MTLRLRLVLALVALVAVGLAVFGFATYGLYSRSQYQSIDDQLRSSASLAAAQLELAAGFTTSCPSRGGGGFPDDHCREDPNHDRPSTVLPTGAYAELRGSDGSTLARIQITDSTALPDLPADPMDDGAIVTTGSTTGSAQWRVLSTSSTRGTVLVAIPTTDVVDALHRLVLIEVIAASLLLVALATGAWLIVRRGLRPLERMASTASTISAGALDQRVAPDDGRTEVGQLGLALNTMLGELETAFQEREATEQRLRRFLADASHELRTPLTSIRGFAELFRLGASNDHVDLPVTMRRIEEESTRMAALVDDLLLLARLDQPRAAAREPVDLAVLAADACSDAVAADVTRSVTLDAPEPVEVIGDRDHLRQAVANLVANAVRHTPAGTPIEVSAHVRDRYATISVRDHGPGLADDALAHVFDRFWQADAARVGTGAGLGLAIVAGIAAEHGGAATVANVADGGARFTITLPRLPADVGASSQGPASH